MTFQLTPLLDLLLIVIFAQFMEMRETTEKQEAVTSEQVATAEKDLETTQAELAKLGEELKEKRTALEQLETDSKQAFADRDALKSALDNVQNERNAIAGLFPELFNVDDQTMQQFIREKEAEGVRLTKEQIEKLRTEFRKLAGITPQEAVEHLMTFDEMRKRVDVWRIHVDARGVTEVQAGKNTIEFRAETATDFEREMIDRVNGLPQPKGVVIIMLSFGNVKLQIYEEVLAGLRDTTHRLNTLTTDSKFYAAVIGLHKLE